MEQRLNPLAQELNELLGRESPAVRDLLSALGRRYYFPKGIVSQSAEAKAKAKRFNATIGIATEGGQAMGLPSLRRQVPELSPDELFTYAPTAGRPELREIWLRKQFEDSPRLAGRKVSTPIVTSALTHGLSILAELFVEPGDVLVIPDQLWGNYRLTFEVRQGGTICAFPFYAGGGFNVEGLRQTVERLAAERSKLIVLLNFPNNPTGYTPTAAESEAIARTLVAAAARGCRVLAICDDAYFNLVYDERCFRESLFGLLAGAHPNLLAVRLDGATKEHFVWGFRVGFLTFGAAGGNLDAVYQALEKKVTGCIRAVVSSSPHISQSLLLKAMRAPGFKEEQAEKRRILAQRAQRVQEILADPKFAPAWEPYPFNSGYFHCLRLKTVEAEPLRLHLLERHQLGVIATAKQDLRVAFSCLELPELPEIYDTILRGVHELERR